MSSSINVLLAVGGAIPGCGTLRNKDIGIDTNDDSDFFDADGDGVSDADDCDPNDAQVGTVDEDGVSEWWVDEDGDGHYVQGNPSGETVCPSEVPEGALLEEPEKADDEDDSNADITVTRSWYVDMDSDGFADVTGFLDPTAGSAYVVLANEDPSHLGYLGNWLSEDSISDANDNGVIDELDFDCNDNDYDVNPGALEVCDGIDNNCNVHIDDNDPDLDPADSITSYPDNDGDGYGNSNEVRISCSMPDDHVLEGHDCDDNNPNRNPGEIEVCNGIDDDCDMDVDQADTDLDAVIVYRDYDGDGYGDSDLPYESCEIPTGYTDVDGDCDDANAAVNPNETEVCNGIDDDCDGDTDTDDSSLDQSTTTTYYADRDGDTYGSNDSSDTAQECDTTAAAAALSVSESEIVTTNGDDYDTVPSVNSGASETFDGFDSDQDGNAGAFVASTEAAIAFTGGTGANNPGRSIAFGQAFYDSNNNPIQTFFVVDPHFDYSTYTNSGAIYFIHDPLTASSTSLDDADVLYSLDNRSLLGFAITTADFTGNGYKDIALGAPGSAANFLHIIEGPLTQDPNQVETFTLSDFNYASYYHSGSDYIGTGEFGVVNYPSGGADLLTETNISQIIYIPDSAITSSSSSTGLAIDSSSIITLSHTSRIHPGVAGDFDGDGTPDFLVGEDPEDSNRISANGATFVAYGPITTNFDVSTQQELTGHSTSGEAFGSAVLTGYTRDDDGDSAYDDGNLDYDGDGYDDAAIADDLADVNGTDSGAVYLFSGSSTGIHGGSNDTANNANVVISGESAGANLGWSRLHTLQLHDLNGTATPYPCLVISSQYYSNLSAQGAVNLVCDINGQGGNFSAADIGDVIIGDNNGDYFGGATVIADPDQDGDLDLISSSYGASTAFIFNIEQ